MARRGHGHSICPRITMYFILVLFSSFNSIEANCGKCGARFSALWLFVSGVTGFITYNLRTLDAPFSCRVSFQRTHHTYIRLVLLYAVWMWMCYRSAGQRRLSMPLIGWEFFFLLYEEPCVFPKKKTKKKRWSLTTIGKSNDILRYPSSFDHTNAI